MKSIYFSFSIIFDLALSLKHNALLKIPILDDTISTPIAMRNGTTLSNPNVDTQIHAQPVIEENWEELVVAGPILVNYISNLMILAGKSDFPLTSFNPNHVYQHITHPNSFRSTVAQIANQIYTVFINAHRNMDQMQLSTQQIPQHLKTILKLLKSASPRVIQAMLPAGLNRIEQISKDFADSANITIKRYESLTLLFQEVIEAMTDLYGVRNTFLMNVNILVNATKEVSKMQQQWNQIARYLNILTIRVETTRETVVYELIDTIKNITSMNGELGAADRKIFVLKMLDTIVEIEQDAHLLYIMAKTYYDVSHAYMVFQIYNVSRLLLLHTDDERQAAMTQLGQNTLLISAEISQMVLERKQQYQQRNQEIQEEYERFIQQMIFEELAAGIGK